MHKTINPKEVSRTIDDIAEFLRSYNDTLRQEIAGADMPPELPELYEFESCVKQKDGREVYFVKRKADGSRAVLRVTDADYEYFASYGGNAQIDGYSTTAYLFLRDMKTGEVLYQSDYVTAVPGDWLSWPIQEDYYAVPRFSEEDYAALAKTIEALLPSWAASGAAAQ
jgi:hypothetical protein